MPASSSGLMDKVTAAQRGEQGARSELLRDYRSFILHAAAQSARRKIDPRNDDEFSVALEAFNEAIDGFNTRSGAAFLSYARMVIRRRLIDHFRRENRHRHLSLDAAAGPGGNEGDWEDDGDTASAWETRAATVKHDIETEARERAREIVDFKAEIKSYGVTLDDLIEGAPTHEARYNRLYCVAEILVGSEDLWAALVTTRRLPVSDLAKAADLHRKSIGRGRQFIIALAILLKNPEYELLRTFIKTRPWHQEVDHEA